MHHYMTRHLSTASARCAVARIVYSARSTTMAGTGKQPVGSGSGTTTSSSDADNFLKHGADKIFAISNWPVGAEAEQLAGSKLIMWTELESTTPFTPLLFQQKTRVKVLRSQIQALIERIRCSAQPNENFRRERLVASAVNAVSERTKFVQVLRDCAVACFDNMQPLAMYMNQLAALEEAIDSAHELFLRQVMLYSVKPLQKFLDGDCILIMRQYEGLEKARDAYDKCRRKKKSKVVTPPHSAFTKPVDPKLAEARKKLEEAAESLATTLNKIPQVQLSLAISFDNYIRAEAAFYKQVDENTRQLKNPDHRKRWQTEPI